MAVSVQDTLVLLVTVFHVLVINLEDRQDYALMNILWALLAWHSICTRRFKKVTF